MDSVNIFHLIENILLQPKNNPVYQFDRYSDIETWLKEQWSGLFRELLNQRSKHTQIASLASQVSTLEEINKTLKRYLEAVISEVSPEGSAKLIEDESKRLEEAQKAEAFKKTKLYDCLIEIGSSLEDIEHAVTVSKSVEDFFDNLLPKIITTKGNYVFTPQFSEQMLNEARNVLGLDPLKLEKDGRKIFSA